jgi:hypothetical protein
MFTQFTLIRQEGIKGAVEPIIIYLARRNTQEIIFSYHDSAICNSDEGAQNLARTRMEAMRDHGMSSRPAGICSFRKVGETELAP